jgi:hypothetical protein
MFYLLLVAFSKSQVNDENKSKTWITDRTESPSGSFECEQQ